MNTQTQKPLAEYLEQYTGMLRHIGATAVVDLPAIKLEPDNAHQVAAVAIYATILQSVGECRMLLNEPTTITIGSVVRSVLESYADLCAVINDQVYIERLLATFTDEKRRLLSNMVRSPENPFHQDLAKKIDVEADLAKLQAELKTFTDRGILPLPTWERFRAAGKEVEDLYRSHYWALCLQGHNNISAIESRHLRQIAENRVEVTEKTQL